MDISLIWVVVAGVILIELGARIFTRWARFHPSRLRLDFIRYEGSIFCRHLFPLEEQRVERGGKPFYFINSKGYRGHDFPAAKPVGTTRIMFYGGSTVFDYDAPGDSDWPHQVERELRARAYDSIDVINAGSPGHASFDCVGRFLAEGHRFQPDVVVLGVCYNDLKCFHSAAPILRQHKPFRYWDDPRITFSNPLDRILASLSIMYCYARYGLLTWRFNIAMEGFRPKGERVDRFAHEALEQYRLTLQTFIDVVRNVNALPVLITEPTLISRDNQGDDLRVAEDNSTFLTHSALCDAYEQIYAAVKDVCKSKNAVCIDAALRLGGQAKYFTDHAHYTPEGSREMSTLVTENLINILGQKRFRSAADTAIATADQPVRRNELAGNIYPLY